MEIILTSIVVLSIGVLLSHYVGFPVQYYLLLFVILFIIAFIRVDLKVIETTTKSISETPSESYNENSPYTLEYYDQNK